MNDEHRGVGDRACWGLAARTITEKILCNPNTTLRQVQQRVRLSEESQTTNYDRGEQWWDSAGSDAPSLTAQLPLLDGAEGKSDGTVHRDNIRALEPDLPGKDVRDSVVFHAETPDAPPMASTRERGVAAGRLSLSVLERLAMFHNLRGSSRLDWKPPAHA